MKKALLSLAALATLTSSLSAELIVGLEYSAVSNMTATQSYSSTYSSSTPDKTTNYSYQPLVFKLGFGTPGDEAFIFSYSSATIDYDGDTKDKTYREFGFDWLKEFQLGGNVKQLHPYLDLGLTAGSQDGRYANASARGALALKIGGGVDYYVLPQLSLNAGIDYRFRGWADIESRTIYGSTLSTESRSDSGLSVTVGVNYWPFASPSAEEDSYEALKSKEEENKSQY